MSAPELLLLGAGGHAESCIDVVECDGRFTIAGLIGAASEVGTSVLGYPVVGTDEDLAAWVQKVPNVLVTVGQILTPGVRRRLVERARASGAQLPVIVSPMAHVSRHAQVGDGTIVMHGAVVNAGARVGRNCIINTMALVEHGATVGDDCHVATGARLNSGVMVGDGSFIGSGAIVRQLAHVGRECVVGMAAVVTRDVADGATYISRRTS
ncbi:MAG: acetyltransferase [Gemmatimonadota bacterium]